MNKNLLRSALWLITYAVLLIAALFHAKTLFSALMALILILSPLFIGIALALILVRPYAKITGHFQKSMGKYKKFAKPLALLTTYIALVAVVIVIISFIVPSLAESVQLFAASVDGYAATIGEFGKKLAAFFNLDSIKFADFNSIFDSVFSSAKSFMSSVFPQIFSFTQSVFKSFINLVLGIILSIYILSDRENLAKGIKRLLYAYLPEKNAAKFWHVLDLSAYTFSNFIVGQATDSTILGVLCFLGMSLLGLAYPLLISTVIAVTSLIPVVGAIIGCIPAIFILLMVDPKQVVIFLIFFLILQQFDNNVVYPKVVGTSIGLPAIWVLLAIIVGGGIFGPLGMLLGVPAASVVYHLINDDIDARSGFPEPVKTPAPVKKS